MRKAILAVAVILLAGAPVSGQEADAWYMTDDEGTTNGADARLLSADAPTGETATLRFSPLADLPSNTYDWVTGTPFAEDMLVTGDVLVDLYFEAGIDAGSTTTVSLIALAPDGTETELGNATDATPGQAAAHVESFTITATDGAFQEGDALLLRISVTETAAAVQLQYGSADAPSGITALPLAILDSDGDGIGDSAERRAGTDPMVAETPDDGSDGGNGTESGNTTAGDDASSGADPDGADGAAGTGDGTSSADKRSTEILIASFFLILCLALAGIALLGRFTA